MIPTRESRRPTVVVVGAGFAGLAAAQDLRAFGYNVRVVEARDRIGGRAWTDLQLGGPVDLGAAWIHGTNGNPLAELCTALGVSTTFLDDKVQMYGQDGQLAVSSEDREMQELYNRVLEVARDSDDLAGRDISLGEAFTRHLAAISSNSTAAVSSSSAGCGAALTPSQRRLLDWHLAHLEYSVNADVEDISLRHGMEVDGVTVDFGGPHPMLIGGYGALAERLAAGLVIEHGAVVEAIEHGGSRPRVHLKNAPPIDCDAVVLTVPLGVLKRHSIAFRPPLPERKLQAIQRVGYGRLNKLVLVFPEPFWRTAATTYIGYAGPKGHFYMFIDVSAVSGVPTLVAMLPGRFAEAVEKTPDSAVVLEAMDILCRIFPDSCPDGPTAYTLTRWGNDPYSWGSYSYMAVGSTERDLYALAQPVGSSLFFAGEATCPECPATVHGAYISGRRMACQVIAEIAGRRDEAWRMMAWLAPQQAVQPVRYPSALCPGCNKEEGNHGLMVLCDACDRGYHPRCVDPPLDEIPSTEWYCPSCVSTQLKANEIFGYAQHLLTENASVCPTALSPTALTAEATAVLYQCKACGHPGKGKSDLARHYASRGHQDRMRSLLRKKTPK